MMRTSAEVWEAPAKRSLALSLLSSDERSIAGTGEAVAGAAAAAAGATAAEGVPAAEGGGGPPVGTEDIGLRRWWSRIVWKVCTSGFVCLCGAEEAHPSRRKNRKNKIK